MHKKVRDFSNAGPKKVKCYFCGGYMDERGKCDNPFCVNFQR